MTWTTNFTITRVEIYARNSDYEFILYKSISGAANSYTFNYAETPPTAYQIRAYYGFEGTPIKVLFKKPAGRRKWEKKK